MKPARNAMLFATIFTAPSAIAADADTVTVWLGSTVRRAISLYQTSVGLAFSPSFETIVQKFGNAFAGWSAPNPRPRIAYNSTPHSQNGLLCISSP